MAFLDSMKFVQVIIDNANTLTAQQEDVLEGEIFVGRAKKFQFGTIPKLGTQANVSLLAGELFTVKYGYNPREYTVGAVSLAKQTVGNATSDQVLDTKIVWVNGEEIIGTMPNIGAIDIVLQCDDSILIEKGYHNGNGRVTVASLASQTQGNASADEILMGEIAWVNGEEIIGTMTNNPIRKEFIKCGETYTIPVGYHHGTGTVTAESLASQTIASATPKDMAEGVTAWVNGELITGILPLFTKNTYTIPINGTYVIPHGIHPGTEVVTQNIEVQEAMTITPAFEDQTISLAGKYMNGDITLTGIDALNFNNFNSDKDLLFTKTITGIDISSSFSINEELYRSSVDNWHDQATDNIYFIECIVTGTTANGTIKNSGIIFVNNLNKNALNTTEFAVIPFQNYSDEYLLVKVSLDEETNSHVFTLTGMGYSDHVSMVLRNSTAFDITVSVKEIMQLRRYGDEHDVDE